jgi:hypothetical protein
MESQYPLYIKISPQILEACLKIVKHFDFIKCSNHPYKPEHLMK